MRTSDGPIDAELLAGFPPIDSALLPVGGPGRGVLQTTSGCDAARSLFAETVSWLKVADTPLTRLPASQVRIESDNLLSPPLAQVRFADRVLLFTDDHGLATRVVWLRDPQSR